MNASYAVSSPLKPTFQRRMAVQAKISTARPAKNSKAVTSPKKQQPFELGFTKNNELFVSRLAMVGFAASLIGEVLTGKGALAQFGYEVGLNVNAVDHFVGFLIAFNLVAAILPASGTFVPQEKESQKDRPSGPLQDPTISMLEPKKFFGFTRFGFSKENELFVGRTAQLGFAFSLIGELVTGKGPLAQFGYETGIPLKDTEFGIIAAIVLMLCAAVNEGTGKFVDE